MLTLPDFAAAAAHPAPVVCDSTIATPLGLRPLELGCDIAMHSATKYLGGHDDLLAGVAVAGDDELRRRLWETRRLTGAVASADTAWLLLRGLEDRSRFASPARRRPPRSSPTACARHPAVSVVRYPGVGGLVCFDVADGEAARAGRGSRPS